MALVRPAAGLKEALEIADEAIEKATAVAKEKGVPPEKVLSAVAYRLHTVSLNISKERK